MRTEILINRRDIRESKVVTFDSLPELQEGDILVKVDEVAFTANNVTYAVAGEFLKYWNFFPTNEDGWGKLPMWGYGDVIASAHSDIEVGERLYGYWPLASHLVISAVQITRNSLADGAPNRQELNAIYNQYTRAKDLPGFAPAGEHLNSLMRPMFTTSFLVDDFLFDNDCFGAKTLILSSASSKTGYGTAFMHHKKRSERFDYEIVGLTSPGNVDFVNSLGCYDRVLPYDEVTTLATDEKAVYVDFSGNGRLRHTIHTHFGDNLTYDCSIGLTDWKMQGSNQNLPGVKARMFFAPAQAQKRIQEWDPKGFQMNLNGAFAEFSEFAKKYTAVEVHSGAENIQSIYTQMVEGTATPSKGYIFSL